MALSPLMRMQLINGVEKVLHAPGNPTHDLQEMTMVLDCHMDKEKMMTLAKDVVGALKSHSRVFANVRCNLVDWKNNQMPFNRVSPLAMIQLGQFAEHYEQTEDTKYIEVLCRYLKSFHARSKLILVLTDFSYEVHDAGLLKESLSPFLQYKLLLTDGEKVNDKTSLK